VLSLFIIGHMGLFFYNKIGSIISIGDLPTTNIIEPFLVGRTLVLPIFLSKKCSWEGDRRIWEGSPVFV
ncbi:hypothetical protein OK844_09200, partial [Streptococcus pneumoniae]|uniref:hypothetical protein n=3 Tax=Streptococcus pneumoniae TaxID=1313 RepID=UPI00099A8066